MILSIKTGNNSLKIVCLIKYRSALLDFIIIDNMWYWKIVMFWINFVLDVISLKKYINKVITDLQFDENYTISSKIVLFYCLFECHKFNNEEKKELSNMYLKQSSHTKMASGDVDEAKLLTI